MRTVLGAIRLGHVRFLVLGALLLAGVDAHAQTDPLASWNDGAAKRAILEFVKTTTDQASLKFAAAESRCCQAAGSFRFAMKISASCWACL